VTPPDKIGHLLCALLKPGYLLIVKPWFSQINDGL